MALKGEIDAALSFLDEVDPLKLDNLELLERFRRMLEKHEYAKQYSYFTFRKGDSCLYAGRVLERFEKEALSDTIEMIELLHERFKKLKE